MSITAQDLVRREVHYCVSSLVHTLAQGYGAGVQLPREVVELHEAAFELAAPVLDYEEAAREAGWEGPFDGDYGETYFQDPTDDMTWCAIGWEALCDAHDIEPYYREVYEHWIVSEWLADKLIEKGEKVDKDFAGMTVWARTTTGQAVCMDSVIAQIAAELNAEG